MPTHSLDWVLRSLQGLGTQAITSIGGWHGAPEDLKGAAGLRKANTLSVDLHAGEFEGDVFYIVHPN
jgi:hypothetical protein